MLPVGLWLGRSERLQSFFDVAFNSDPSNKVFRYLQQYLHVAPYACCIACPFYVPLIHYHNIWLNNRSVQFAPCGCPLSGVRFFLCFRFRYVFFSTWLLHSQSVRLKD
jgi:hypothetical protein